MAVSHRSDRVLPFTDAVVAIAMTLLILPLIELGTEVAKTGLPPETPLPEVLLESVPLLIGFTVSFFVIARLWWAHHVLFARVETWTGGLVALDVVWLFTIVLLPFPTTFSTTYTPSPLLALVYVGTMTASSATLTLLAHAVLRRTGRDREALQHFFGNLTTTIAFAVALALCALLPALWYAPLFLLAFTGPVDRIVKRRIEARVPA